MRGSRGRGTHGGPGRTPGAPKPAEEPRARWHDGCSGLAAVASLRDRALTFRPGEVIERRYRILEQIAEGGMGTVFLAQHLLIKRRVALKLLHSELASDHNMVLRFLDEASAAGTLGHPKIVKSTDMGFTRANETSE